MIIYTIKCPSDLKRNMRVKLSFISSEYFCSEQLILLFFLIHHQTLWLKQNLGSQQNATRNKTPPTTYCLWPSHPRDVPRHEESKIMPPFLF